MYINTQLLPKALIGTVSKPEMDARPVEVEQCHHKLEFLVQVQFFSFFLALHTNLRSLQLGDVFHLDPETIIAQHVLLC